MSAEKLELKAFKTKRITVDASLVQRLNAADETLTKMNERLDRLLNRVERGSSSPTGMEQRISEPEIKTRDLKNQSQIESTARPTEKPTKQSLTVDNLEVAELKVAFINGHSIDQLVYGDRDLNVKNELKVDQLYVNSMDNFYRLKEKADTFNEATRIKKSADENSISYTGEETVINVDHLIVDGEINQFDLATLQKYALKTSGGGNVQRLKGQFNFTKLHLNRLVVPTRLISDIDIDTIIRTDDGGSYELGRDVRFAGQLNVDRLYVRDRINNLRIASGGRFDALHKNAKEEQTILGHKSFDTVQLLSPIELHGKLNHSNLDKMNPFVSLANDIVLQGKNKYLFLN